MEPDPELLFEALTPLGFTVRVRRERWNLITTIKHPVMLGHEGAVTQTLESPEQVRQSRSDPQVLLFYRGRGRKALGLRGHEARDGSGLLDHRVSGRRHQGRDADMAEVKVFYDREGKTLTVWFTERSREYICEETGDEVVLMKDATGRVLGFEKLNFSIPQSDSLRVALETVPA